MVCQFAGDPVDTDTVDAVGLEDPAGSFRAGESAAIELAGIFFEGGIDIVTCPKGEQDAGQYQINVSRVKPVIITVIGHGIPPCKW